MTTHTAIATMLSTTLHQHIVDHLDLTDHSYEEFTRILSEYCVINRGRPNEQPLRIDSYMEGGVEVYHLDINACLLITSGYPRHAGRLFGSIHPLFNGISSENYTSSIATQKNTLATSKSDNIWATRDETYFTHPDAGIQHPAVTSRDITDMINRLAGWDGKGKPAEHNSKHPANDVKAIEGKKVMLRIRNYVIAMFPHLCKKAGVEVGAGKAASAQITEQPLGYYDIGIAVYTDKMNRQQNMLVMTPDLAECVCSIFNRRVFIQMQQELLRLRAVLARTGLPAMSPLTLTELNGTDTPATVVQASPMLQAHLACYTVQQAIDTFGDKGYDEDVLEVSRDKHEENQTSCMENGVYESTYSTTVWQCAYRLNPIMWHTA